MAPDSPLYELARKEIIRRTDARSKQRAKSLVCKYERVNKAGTVVFKTESQTNPGQGIFWTQRIKLLTLYTSLREDTANLQERVRNAMDGELKVHCDCPAFSGWGWAYIMTQEKAKLGYQENRFPSERNPNLKGAVCKHIQNVLERLPFNAPVITKAIKEIKL